MLDLLRRMEHVAEDPKCQQCGPSGRHLGPRDCLRLLMRCTGNSCVPIGDEAWRQTAPKVPKSRRGAKQRASSKQAPNKIWTVHFQQRHGQAPNDWLWRQRRQTRQTIAPNAPKRQTGAKQRAGAKQAPNNLVRWGPYTCIWERR